MQCGGLLGLTCGGGMFCDFEPASCGDGDQQGICRPLPQACTKDCPGVCGCDGAFYCNECTAHQAGVDEASDTSCKRADAGAGDAGEGALCERNEDCQAGLLCYYPCGIPDCMNRCLRATGRCPLFP